MFEVKKEILETHEALLSVEIEDKAVRDAMQKAARTISRKVFIPGFRQGKAPYSRVVRHVGEDAVLQEAAEAILQDIYPEVIEKAEISPYTSGELQTVDPTPLTFKIRVPLEPTVQLGDYLALHEEWQEANVSEEEIATVLEQIREEHTVLEPLDRPAQWGDEVHINVVGTSEDDIVVDEDDIEVLLSEERPFLSPDFTVALTGMTAGEEKSFSLTLPEDFAEASLQRADVDFEVKVTQVYERQLPDLDDALASAVGSFETLDALKQDIHDRLLTYKSQHSAETYRETLVRALVDQAEAHYPPILIEETLDDMIENSRQRLQREHKLSLEDALQLDGKTMEQFREELRPNAEQQVKRSLVLGEFARQEKIEVSDAEVIKNYTDMLVEAGLEDQATLDGIQLDSPLGHSLRNRTYGQKVVERLEQIGRGEVEASSEASIAEETSEESEGEEAMQDTEPATVEETPDEAGAPAETDVKDSDEA